MAIGRDSALRCPSNIYLASPEHTDAAAQRPYLRTHANIDFHSQRVSFSDGEAATGLKSTTPAINHRFRNGAVGSHRVGAASSSALSPDSRRAEIGKLQSKFFAVTFVTGFSG